MEETVILKGPIPPSGVLPLVQAIGIGRQTNVVELLEGEAPLGRLSIRSGKVLSIDFGESTGVDALERFVSHSGGTFRVKSLLGAPLQEPIGDLRALLQQLGRGRDRVSLMRDLPAGAPSVQGTGVQAPPSAIGREPVPQAPPPERRARLSSLPPAPPAAAPEPPPQAAPPQAAPPPAAPEPPPQAAPPQAAPPQAAPPPPRAASEPRAPVDISSAPKPSHEVELAPAGGTILAVASAKGGVGKTTLTMNLAVAMARRGLKVTVVDSDPNGGVSAAANAHRRLEKGAFDVVCGAATLSEALLSTRMEGLKVLPAGGAALSFEQIENAQGHRHAWRTLLSNLARGADVVLVDTAGGVYGPTRVMLSCATHVVGVLQAEPLALRASHHFERAVAAVDPAPKLVGIAMNMFDSRGSTSPTVLQEACDAFPPGVLFDTSIPRTAVINDATLRGVVAGQGDLGKAPSVAWTFEQLSAELLDRIEVSPVRAELEDEPLF